MIYPVLSSTVTHPSIRIDSICIVYLYYDYINIIKRDKRKYRNSYSNMNFGANFISYWIDRSYAIINGTLLICVSLKFK